MVATFSQLHVCIRSASKGSRKRSKFIKRTVKEIKAHQEPDHGAKDASTWEQQNRKRGDHIQPGHIGWHLRGKFSSFVT